MDELKHYGVPGMKWGVRKRKDYVSWSTRKYQKKLNKYSDMTSEKRQRKQKKIKALKQKLHDSKQVDKYRSYQSKGKAAVKTILLGGGWNRRHYDEMRARGFSRASSLFHIRSASSVHDNRVRVSVKNRAIAKHDKRDPNWTYKHENNKRKK